MAGSDDGADACPAVRHGREGDPLGKNAFGEKLITQRHRQGCVPDDYWRNRRLGGAGIESQPRQPRFEELGIVPQPLSLCFLLGGGLGFSVPGIRLGQQPHLRLAAAPHVIFRVYVGVEERHQPLTESLLDRFVLRLAVEVELLDGIVF